MDATPSRSRLPLGFLGMIALVVLVEVFLSRHRLDLTDTATLSWTLSGRAAREEAKGRAILCAGDSLAKHALLPRVIEAKTALPTYNLAAAGASAPATYFVLRRALDSGAKPSAVIVDFMPNLQAGRPHYQARAWQEFLGFREFLDLARADRDPSFVVGTAVGMLLPSVRARHEIRAAILSALRGETDPLPEENRVNVRNWAVNLGANLAAVNAGFKGNVSEEAHKKILSDSWVTNRVNTHYIRRIFEITSARGIPVYWLLPPTSPGVHERRRKSGADEKHTQFVRSIMKEYPHLVVLDGRESGYDHRLFVDPIHLDGRGATTLSADIGAILARRLTAEKSRPPDRWIALPRYRDEPAGMAMEDVEQSRAELKRMRR